MASLVPLKFPPGVYKNGTRYQAQGRWFDASLVRWYENAMQPVGGWVPLKLSSGDAVSLGGPVRTTYAWRDKGGRPRLAFGTDAKAYAFIEGGLSDITPAGATTGSTDAEITVGNYGDGVYGSQNYGLGDITQGKLTEVGTWQMDNFGEVLVTVPSADGRLWSWTPGDAALTVIENAPTGVRSLVVTPERFLVALGAGGDSRVVQWADQESLTTWEPDATNQAGDFPLSGAGELMCGRRGKNETLLFTDRDLWVMRFIGGALVYSFLQAGAACGIISRSAVGMVGARAIWMGHNGFFDYNGYVSVIPCEVSDYVFSDLNRTQVSKIVAVTIADFHEVWWFYPSGSSNENDRYVAYNFEEKFWMVGELARTSGVDRGPFPYPVMGTPAGAVFEHERGTDMGGLLPYAETGPFEIGAGDQTMDVLGMVPDDKTAGDVQARFYTAFYPDDPETERGPFALGSKTDLRFAARQARFRVEQVRPGWRLGVPRFLVNPAGGR